MANSINSRPVGFRFNPTDEELLHHYLKNKVSGNESLVDYIRPIDICKSEPWDIPGQLNDDTGIDEWFFFSELDIKYPKSHRCNRATSSGFWKSTGKDRKIMARGTKKQIGTKKTLVFRRGRVPNEGMTNWVIHEYHLLPDNNFADQRPFVICRLKKNPDVNLSKFDKSNGLVNSTFENVSTVSGPSESELKIFDPFNSVFDNENSNEATSKICFDIIELQASVGMDTSDDETLVVQSIRRDISPTGNRFQYREENETYLPDELQSSSYIDILQPGRTSRDTSDDETFVGAVNDISDYLSFTREFIRRRRIVSRIASRFAKYREENKIESAEVWQSRFDEALRVIKPFFYFFLLFLCFYIFVFMSIRFSLNVLRLIFRLILRDNRLSLLIITILLFQPLIVIV